MNIASFEAHHPPALASLTSFTVSVIFILLNDNIYSLIYFWLHKKKRSVLRIWNFAAIQFGSWRERSRFSSMSVTAVIADKFEFVARIEKQRTAIIIVIWLHIGHHCVNKSTIIPFLHCVYASYSIIEACSTRWITSVAIPPLSEPASWTGTCATTSPHFTLPYKETGIKPATRKKTNPFN